MRGRVGKKILFFCLMYAEVLNSVNEKEETSAEEDLKIGEKRFINGERPQSLYGGKDTVWVEN